MDANRDQKIAELLRKIDELSIRNERFQQEINYLRQEIQVLLAGKAKVQEQPQHTQPKILPVEPKQDTAASSAQQIQQVQPEQAPKEKTVKEKSNLEEFIGGRLINIIGIAITVIGIGLGAKYAIDRDWLSPVVRIVLGYLAGIILMAIGLRLKSKYETFSAALLSGGIAVMYFISFFAYSFYDLVPAIVAFLLMLAFTVFTIISALQYNRQIIAHLGLVGAYAIPFITDTGVDNGAVLFVYMLIINLGILFLAFKKDWKTLNYVAFGFSWLIFLSWYFNENAYEYEFSLSFGFAITFFILFYLMVLAYKLIRKEKFGIGDIIVLLFNTFFFFGLGYHMLDEGLQAESYLGLFTLGNAFLHFIIVLLFNFKQGIDKNFKLFTIGLVITFITIAIPVQLNGYWVTLLWIAEAVVLFWIGRARKAGIYEYLSYPLILIAFFSLVHDWYSIYPEYRALGDEMLFSFLFNIHFLNSLLVAIGFGALAIINHHKKYLEGQEGSTYFLNILNYTLPLLVFFVLFYAIRMEIVTYWNKQLASFSFKISETNRYIRMFRRLCLHDYYMLYLSALYLLNLLLYKSKVFAHILHSLSIFLLFFFVILGLRRIGILREEGALEFTCTHLNTGIMSVLIGYISYGCVAILLLFTHQSVKTQVENKALRKLFSVFAHFIILGVLTGELYHSLDKYMMAENPNIFISILWGLYALILIVAGIARKRKHLRISAIALFGITLIKLFFYDISNVTLLGRFILLFSLGILLLIISFLYTRYKHIILMRDED